MNEELKVIYMVLEYGEIDLASLLKKKQLQRREQQAKLDGSQAAGKEGSAEQARLAGPTLDENFLRMYWQVGPTTSVPIQQW